MLLAAGQVWLLFLAVGALALLVSTLTSERGRAFGITIGIVLAMYVGNFLFALWGPLNILTRATLFRYFTPGPTIQFGDVAWGGQRGAGGVRGGNAHGGIPCLQPA